MSKRLELAGKTSGKLTVIKRVQSNKKGESQWLCSCKCGNEVVVVGYRLNSGNTRRTLSCGCLQRRVNTERVTTHGKYGTRLHKTWQKMKERCNNANSKDYHNYGGRGITYHKEWEEFQPFYDWATENGYSDELTIDRIDVNGNYEPSNCGWSNKKTQANNTRLNVHATINGVTKTIAEWSDYTGIKSGTLHWRYKNGIKGSALICKKDRRGKGSLI